MRILSLQTLSLLAITVCVAQDDVDSSLYIAPSDPAPTMPGLETNPQSPEKIELGRLLFFDPILSRDQTMSCATCHHPAYGLADGRETSIGNGGHGIGPDRTGGVPLTRHAPSLWNAGFLHSLFWDGRSATLEAQSDDVLREPTEMNNTPDVVVAALRAIPKYKQLFDAAFAGDSLSYDSVLKALASFQRSLYSLDSPYDDYRWGEETALNASEQRGMGLFFSTKWNCGTCHPAPLFHTNEFVVTGVPESEPRDEGRRAITGEGPAGAFKVPTLRNIALTAPYMHNGTFKTLEDVIRFYANGAGWDHPDLDPRAKWIDTTEAEIEDVIAFLHALTDTSKAPKIPEAVPSGLPVPNATPSP